MIVAGTILTALAILPALFCILALRKHQAVMRKQHAGLLSMLACLREETEQRIAELGHTVGDLDQCRLSMETACEVGFPPSRRTQAMQLLRSGVSPGTAAASLGIAAREMQLVAKVSRILTVD